MRPEIVAERVLTLAKQHKLLEAAWTADLRSSAPDHVQKQELDLSLNSFLIGAYHAIGLYAMLLRQEVPDEMRQAVLCMMQREIIQTTGTTPKMAIVFEDLIKETLH